MHVRFDKRFEKDILGLTDAHIFTAIQDCIANVKAAETIAQIRNCKKLQGFTGYYRVRCGDYRLGISITDGEVIFIRCLHRKELYRFFP